ncbi:MAG TPA: hypothetical protein VKR32_08695 [Puia sp.]|nr:hypothetical protein [Puia sp.]
MKFSVFAVILALLALLYCLAFLLVPVQFVEQYGSHLDANGVQIARLFGGSLVGFAVGNWMVRNQSPASIAARIVLWATGIANVVYLVVAINGIRNNLINSMGWSSVALHALIIVGCIYYLNTKKAAVAAA